MRFLLANFANLAILALMSAGLWSGPVHARASTPEIQGSVADAATREAAAEVLEAPECKSRLLEELATGQGPASGCDQARRRLARSIIRWSRRKFGYVERRDVQLAEVRLVLGVARRCRTWPLRSEGRAVLDPRDIEAAGCRAGRYEGPVAVTLVDAAGRRVTLPPLMADEDGELRVEIGRLDAVTRAADLGGLDAWARIELGHDAWAGSIDLVRLRQFRADWHHRWVAAGRGVPALFVVAHPDHPGAAEAEAAAVAARLLRQRADFEAVRRGRMSALEFLERYPGSPYRRELEADLAGRGRLTRPTSGSHSARRRTPR